MHSFPIRRLSFVLCALLAETVLGQYSDEQFIQLMQQMQQQQALVIQQMGAMQGFQTTPPQTGFQGSGSPFGAGSPSPTPSAGAIPDDAAQFMRSLQPLLEAQAQSRNQARQELARKNTELKGLGLSPLQELTGNAMQDNLVVLRNFQTMEANIQEMERRAAKGDRKAGAWAAAERKKQAAAAEFTAKAYRDHREFQDHVDQSINGSRAVIDNGNDALHKSRLSSSCMDGSERLSAADYRARAKHCAQLASESEEANIKAWGHR